MFQYASTGRIAGYSGNLDLNIFYGTKADWKALCKVVKGGSSSGSGGKEKAVGISRANVAVQIMRHLCTCDLHGYSQPGRYGTSGYCSVATDAGTVKVKKGDRDCSSAVCEAWELALAGTSHEGEITRYEQRNKSVSAEGYSAMTELTMTVNVRFKNNKNHKEDFEEQFTASQSYETTLSLNSVQDELVTKMVRDICEQIFNRTVANW